MKMIKIAKTQGLGVAIVNHQTLDNVFVGTMTTTQQDDVQTTTEPNSEEGVDQIEADESRASWTSEQDQALKIMVEAHTDKDWSLIANSLGKKWTAQQLQNRWQQLLHGTANIKVK